MALNWGILGTGNIANQFAAGVRGLGPDAQSVLAAVGSRAQRTADAFAEQYEIPRAHPTYDALLADDAVDAIYLSLPNSMHLDWTLKAIAAGKHVLCEKPIARNADEAERMFDAAQKQGVLLVEAFMYRSHPLTHKALGVVRDGTIGRLKVIRASFCYSTSKVADNVRFDPSLAGGAVMDIGCYCVSFARLFAGREPVSVHTVGHVHETGVDDYAAAVLDFGDGLIANLACGMTVQADNTAHLGGETGHLMIPIPWKPPVDNAVLEVAAMTPPKQDQKAGQTQGPYQERITADAPGPLYGMEAEDFARAVAGKKPPSVSRQDTIGNMRVLDKMRRQLGLSY